jgi:hypothetical protein
MMKMRALAILLCAFLLPVGATAQLAYGRGFVPATALFPSSGTSCTLQSSIGDNTVKNRTYWWNCNIDASNPTVRFSFASPILGPTYGLAGVSVRIMNSSTSNRDICAVFSSIAYFTHNVQQVNQTNSDWRRTTWIGGSAGNGHQVTIDANTTPWLIMVPPVGPVQAYSVIDVMGNTPPNPTPAPNEIAVREVIIGRCSNFCSGAAPLPTCCSGGSCSSDYSGAVRIYGVHFY